jgi:lipopolysaccharide heptosyltransferase III
MFSHDFGNHLVLAFGLVFQRHYGLLAFAYRTGVGLPGKRRGSILKEDFFTPAGQSPAKWTGDKKTNCERILLAIVVRRINQSAGKVRVGLVTSFPLLASCSNFQLVAAAIPARLFPMAASSMGGFFERTRAAKKVMVLDLGFLGDTVHLLPALWMVRQAYPQARLHAAVASHIMSLMDCVPWVDRVWGYMRFPRHATLRENLDMVWRLRREKFDVLINLNGSDRSSWLSFLSGARERLGRMPDGGGPPFWKQMFTAHVQHSFWNEPIYAQRCHCLEQAGFPARPPEFHVQIPETLLQAAKISPADAGTYFHVSPFTTDDRKELPPEQLAELISALSREFPEKRWVFSCAPTERERKKMDSLAARLPVKPWRTCAGDLKLTELAAVIQHSAAHFCGDTGTLHLALMTGARTVSWFWPNPGTKAWVPEGRGHRTIVGRSEAGKQFLCGIETGELIHAVQAVLDETEASKPILKRSRS